MGYREGYWRKKKYAVGREPPFRENLSPKAEE
jgi:hypothetical protein